MRGLVTKLLLSLFALALVPVGLIGVELGMRRANPDYLREISLNDMNYLHTYSETYGWELKKNFSYELGGERVNINPEGYRGRQYPSEKAGNKKRVVILGDSIAFGYGVSDEETFAYKLDAADEDLEVVNLAVQGYGTDQALIRLQNQAFDFDPDFIVLGFCVFNDFYDNSLARFMDDQTYPKPIFVYEGGQLKKRAAHLQLNLVERLAFEMSQQSIVYNRLLDLLSIDRQAHREALVTDVPRTSAHGGEAFPLTLRLIREMKREADVRGIRFLVLVFPDLENFRADAPVLEGMRRSPLLRGVELVDMYAEFARRGYDREHIGEIALDDVFHLTPLGHDIAADVLRGHL